MSEMTAEEHYKKAKNLLFNISSGESNLKEVSYHLMEAVKGGFMVSRAIVMLKGIAEGNNNDVEAPLFLAEIYRDGIGGVKQDVSEVERYLRIAEDRGSTDASIKLGDMCLIKHNSYDAKVHFEKAAKGGSSTAKDRLEDLNEFKSVNSGINNNDDVSDVVSRSYRGSKLPKNDEIKHLTKSYNEGFKSVKQVQNEVKRKKQKVISPTSGWYK